LRVLVTGASGFIGSHLIPALLAAGHEVSVLVRSVHSQTAASHLAGLRAFVFDLHDSCLVPSFAEFGKPDVLMHLAWQGLPQYREPFHFEENLPANFRFIKHLVTQGLSQVLVTGTCLEYGMRNGVLDENAVAEPVVAYAIAKDSLRRQLEVLGAKVPFILQWPRLFYMHGSGQNRNSLLSQLDAAIDSGQDVFNMSGGEQLRDYLPVANVAHYLARLIATPDCKGAINICSGKPVSVRSMVERRILERDASMRLNLGHYPYNNYEPFAFWGDTNKLNQYLDNKP
jgi:nucleoside-diphosphate-sugar epimerase